MLLITLGVLVQTAAAAPPVNTAILRDAHSAQRRFEAVRRSYLPRKPSVATSGSCGTRIGRFCYWYDSTENTATRDHARIVEAREALLAVLDSASLHQPSDGWVAGQRVRYLIEGGRWQDAVGAARACQADRWWCLALEGLAQHVGQRYVAADSVFAAALDAMPEQRRCQWLDLRVLALPRAADALSQATCTERAAIANRLWTLSQPLWMTPGNDLRTEHFARLTMALVLSESANAHNLAWGDDSQQLLLRYGWAEWFTRSESTGLYASFSVTGHDREPSYYFFPDVPATAATPWLSATSWHLRETLAPTRYAPRHIERLTSLAHQVARFPRGDSLLLAASYRIDDTALVRDSIDAAMVWLHDGALRTSAHAGRDRMLATVPNDTIVMSLEVLGRGGKRAARSRFALAPLPCNDGWCLSDLLLIDPSRADGALDPESALAMAPPVASFAAGSPIGVFWELQSPATVHPLWLSLTITPTHVSLVRRAASRLGLGRNASAVRLRWQAVPRERQGQAVTLRLPRGARGTYRVLLTAEAPGVRALAASREVEITP